MGFTNKTPNYDLPQWIGTDQPTWLVDVNGAFSAIDTAISDVNVTATGAKNTADSASGLASTAKDAADAATQAATDATTAATAATNAATAATEKAAQAEQTANAAAGTASTAITNANNAVQVANSAENKADQALANTISPWFRKSMNITDIELANGLTKNSNYFFTNAANLFYNKSLNLMIINMGIVLNGLDVTLTTNRVFNSITGAYIYPLVKLPFSYDSGLDISIANTPLIAYLSPSNVEGKTLVVAGQYNSGIIMQDGSAWLGFITSSTGSTKLYQPQRVCLSNFTLNTKSLGNVTLQNWSNA